MIIHFWNLPEKRNYVIFKKEFKEKINESLKNQNSYFKIRKKIKKGKISIHKIIRISKEKKIPLEKIEKNIIWLGGNNSKGLSNPKLPIRFSSRAGARFIAAIVNDGTLTKNNLYGYGRLMYDNFDKDIRYSVIKDYLNIFGGHRGEIAFRESKKKKKYLEFSSVIRDIVEKVLKQKGPKSESNIKIPNFIFKEKENMLGWIEQTIADEGDVKHYPTKSYADKYRRAIVWRRSLDVTRVLNKLITKNTPFRKLPLKLQKSIEEQKCNLIENEKKMLELLGINYKVYNLGVYLTKNNKIRTRWQISITKRENLLKLRNLIKIPSKLKDKKFTLITKRFVKFKEPLKVKEMVMELGKKQKPFTSLDLKEKMNYKETNTAIKWLKLLESEGFIKKIKESSYGNGKYRQPAEYEIIQDK